MYAHLNMLIRVCVCARTHTHTFAQCLLSHYSMYAQLHAATYLSDILIAVPKAQKEMLNDVHNVGLK